MRGKSIDANFVADFVRICCDSEKTSPKEIASEAKIQIQKIDSELRRIDSLKLERAKLMDVVSSLDFPEETESSDESDSYEESDFEESDCLSDGFVRQVCLFVANNPESPLKNFISYFGENLKPELFLSLKKLNQAGIVVRNTNMNFIPGPKWYLFNE